MNRSVGRRRSRTGALQDAGFRDRDYVIGVNGKEFTDRRQMKALMTLATRAETVTFLLLRGGKTMELKVSGGIFKGERKEMGGTFERAARPR
jgi:S1-C subfamily serine protease